MKRPSANALSEPLQPPPSSRPAAPGRPAVLRGGAVFFLFLLTFLAVSLPSSADGGAERARGPAESTIIQVLSAYGGRENLSKVRTYREKGSIFAVRRNVEGPFVRTSRRPGELKVLLLYPNNPEVRILKGERGWRTDRRGNLSPVQGFLVSSMILQSARMELPWILDERRRDVKFLGQTGDEGKRVTRLGIDLGEGLFLHIYVDEASGLIIRSTGILETPAMSTRFEVIYSDFRPVGGILFPRREETFASGVHTGSIFISEVELNPPLDTGEFSP